MSNSTYFKHSFIIILFILDYIPVLIDLKYFKRFYLSTSLQLKLLHFTKD
jgi:hypothetical protein